MTRPPREKKPPRPLTEERLRKAALHYLERFTTSAGNLRTVLERRVRKNAMQGLETPEADQWIERIVASLVAAGVIDDRAYAEMRAASLVRAGRSRARIKATLQQKRVDPAALDGALEQLQEDQPNADLVAAVNFARRRRLGPYAAGDRAARRLKDMAALARAGFSSAIARRVVDAEDIETLTAQLEEDPS